MKNNITRSELHRSVIDDIRELKQALITIAIEAKQFCKKNGCPKANDGCHCKGADEIKQIAEEALQKVAGDYNDKS